MHGHELGVNEEQDHLTAYVSQPKRDMLIILSSSSSLVIDSSVGFGWFVCCKTILLLSSALGRLSGGCQSQ